MRRMPDQVDHDAEVKEQAAIEAEVKAAEAGPSKPQQDAVKAQAKAARAKVTLKHTGGEDYPVTVEVVGAPDGLVFDQDGATVEVDPEVAEQVKYLPKVEVA